MLKWLKRILGAYARRYFDQQMRNFIDAGDYEAVLNHATNICRKRENDISAQHWRALALLWLEGHQEALDIVNRIERLTAEGILQLDDAWTIAYEEIKCYALNGLKQYDALHEFSSACIDRHPDIISLASFQLVATIQLGMLTASTPCLHFLDGSINNFHEAWEFQALYSAHRHLGNKERASEIARLALANYPNDAAVQEMAKGKHVTPNSVSPCVTSRDSRSCGPR